MPAKGEYSPVIRLWYVPASDFIEWGVRGLISIGFLPLLGHDGDMKVLFFTHTRLGDAVLSTGVIRHYIDHAPDVRITVVCSPLVAGIFEAIPHVERVIAVRKRSWSRHWLDVWHTVRGTRWDVVVDLRNSVVSRLIRARKRFIWRPQPDHLHKVEQIAATIGVTPPPAPQLWFDAATSEKARGFLMAIPSPRIVVAPVANWPGKTWPASSFVEFIAEIASASESPLSGASFIVMAGPGEEAVARQVLAACPPGRGFDAIAKFSPLEAAAVISDCDAFIGNDSGLMHCAAATGIPTLGLFGPSKRSVYRPWGPDSHMVETPESYAEIVARPDYSPHATMSYMESLSVERVLAAFKKMMTKA